MSEALRKYYPYLLLVPVVILILIPGAERFEGSNLIEAFGNWAWSRHHNMLSWAARSFMILPFIYFAYRRSWHGVVVSVILIATNFFWFPMPEHVDPQALEFLDAERQWMMSAWDLGKVILVLSVPISLTLLGMAFWKRSLLMGLLLIDAIFVLKAVYSVALGESGWALVPFLVVGCAVFNVVVLYVVRLVRNRLHHNEKPLVASNHAA